MDILDQTILCCEGCLPHCRMFSSITDFYLLDSECHWHSSVVRTKKVSRHCQMTPGKQICPTENHCQKDKNKFGANFYFFSSSQTTPIHYFWLALFIIYLQNRTIQERVKLLIVPEWLKAWALQLHIWVQKFVTLVCTKN